jgi:hypothetical protein
MLESVVISWTEPGNVIHSRMFRNLDYGINTLIANTDLPEEVLISFVELRRLFASCGHDLAQLEARLKEVPDRQASASADLKKITTVLDVSHHRERIVVRLAPKN